jgi:uncharacterized membrane protein YgcG
MKTAAFLIVIGATLGACSNMYYERKDSVTMSNGDSVEANRALQIADPWPKGSQNTNIPMDPVKAAQAMYKYRCGGSSATGPSSGFSVNSGGGSGGGGGGGVGASPEASGGYC